MLTRWRRRLQRYAQRILNLPQTIRKWFRWKYELTVLTFKVIFYNEFVNGSYMLEVFMEPMVWIVDHFTKALGPILVGGVVILTSSVLYIVYWVGFPYYWNKSPMLTSFLLVLGHWLLVNVIFHFFMAVYTEPGAPPQGILITEAVSVCKKCIAPKPPRTHHCSVCNRCILKMDHHCPWLNNCVGHYNHRYFFMYMVYMTAGTIFIMSLGFEIAYKVIWLGGDSGPGLSEALEYVMDDDGEEVLEGYPAIVNGTHVIPVHEGTTGSPVPFEPTAEEMEKERLNYWYRFSIMYCGMLIIGVFFSLGGLATWHSRLISRGETSIEAHINKKETERLAKINQVYQNPYDFGTKGNWRIFLGMVHGRGLLHVLFPSRHMAAGNGLTWPNSVLKSPDDTNEEPRRTDIDPQELEMPQDDSNVRVLEDAAKLVDRLLDGEQLDEDVPSRILSRITAEIEKEKETLTNCRTAQLGLQCILCRFIKAERTRNWDLHLSTVHEMLPYFAASGQNLYTKSAYVYLQDMVCLEDNHPDVYSNFQNGHHVIRRHDRYWSGLSTDLIIEQVLTRSVKSRGGLTRGSGMNETQRLVWLLAMPACAQVNLAMQTLTGVQYQSSKQHKDMGKAWKKRDSMKDTYKLLDALKQWNPVAPDTSLRGLVNVVTANESVNVDMVLQVGQSILESMVGGHMQEYSFKRKCQAVTLGSKTAVTIKDEQVQVDPQLLFQRLSIIANTEENPADAFKYVLSSYPPALFESPVLSRGANKASLADDVVHSEGFSA